MLALGQLQADREGELDPEPDVPSRSLLGSWEETGKCGMKNGHEEDGEELWRLHPVGPFQTFKPRGLAISGCAGMRGQMLSHLPSSYEVPL